MNLKLVDGIVLGLLVTQISLVNSRNIPPSVRCLELDFPAPCLNRSSLQNYRVPVTSEFIPSDLDRRAGGRPKQPKPKEGESSGGSSGPGGETSEGQRTGTVGSNDESQAKNGGSSDVQGQGKVPGGSTNTQEKTNLPVAEAPPSKRNNYNKPAQTSEKMDTKGLDYKEEDLRKFFHEEVRKQKLQDADNYFFYSGTYPIDAVGQLRPLYDMRLKNPNGELRQPTTEDIENAKKDLPAMNDIRKQPSSTLGPSHKAILTDEDLVGMDYYWAANSKAYAQIAKGNAILAIRMERSINQAAAGDRASFWWTWEIAELTRNPNIDNIKIIPIDSKYEPIKEQPDPRAIGKPITIWSRGDPPLSSPADLQYQMARPEQSLSYDEVFEENVVAKEPPGWDQMKGSFGHET